ncbi:hypothetical protein BD410DRAFT_402808 [Rickenella mellea]|uniref:F-box domain-containing protein n=1 Tax=Rickenella mellea TaxID=50990 RepID=A0A4Y7PXH5_9AGAM|nr:hypothetical protein BD410DRAFT_402808 [Rickenella mellea]
MAGFAALPSDVLANIFLELSLRDLLSVRQVSTTIHEAISTDKLLWMNIFKHYVIDGGKCAIPYRKPLSLADAVAIESWTRNAFVLGKAYLSNSPLSVHLLGTGIRAVTWVKLIRGRWCLAASSNTSESRLTLWDILSSDNRICAEIFMPGPTMDGEIEDRNSEIIIAISVGSRERHVQILTVGTSAGVPHILKLKTIPGADHVLCLRGSYLGFAVIDGDDSNPIVLDWKRDTQWVLKPSIPIASLRDIVDRTTCLAMTIWDAFVVVAFANELRVSTYPESHSGHCELLYTHNVPRGTNNVRFVNTESVAISLLDDAERTGVTHLHILFGKDDGDVYAQALDAKGQLQGNPVECDVPRPADDSKYPVEMIRMTMGYTGRKFIGLFSSEFHCLPPRLLVASIRPSEPHTGCDHNDICTDYHILPTANSPFLHFWPCFHFDDSRGVLLIGTSRGEICVARFVHKDIILPGSLMDELPPLQAKDIENELSGPVVMDLPLPIYGMY